MPMSEKQLLLAIESVRVLARNKQIEQFGSERVKRIEHDRQVPINVWQAVTHAQWMCVQMKEFVETGRIEKAHRWLGFAQGLLCAVGLASINDFREINMPPDEEFRP